LNGALRCGPIGVVQACRPSIPPGTATSCASCTTPRMAGKTTNLQRICDVIRAHAAVNVHAGRAQRRTMFFDWLEIDGPSQNGQALKFSSLPARPSRARVPPKPLIEMQTSLPSCVIRAPSKSRTPCARSHACAR